MSKRSFRIFKEEKYYFGKDKDQMLAELKGITGNVYSDILDFDNLVHKWTVSVKDATIKSFATTEEGVNKFHKLMKLKDYITTLKGRYSTGLIDWTDYVLIFVPLIASMAGLGGQIYSLYQERKR